MSTANASFPSLRKVRGATFASACLAAASAGLIAYYNSPALQCGLLLLVVLAMGAWLYRPPRRWLLWPFAIVALAYVLTAFLGWGFYTAILRYAPVSARVVHADAAITARLYLLAVVSFGLGFVVVGLVGGVPRPRTIGGRRIDVLKAVTTSKTAVLVVLLPLVALWVGAGPGALMRRDSYLGLAGPPLVLSLGQVGSLPALALLGFVRARTGRHAARVFLEVVALLYATTFFALGTRTLTLVPLLLGVGRYLSGERGRRMVMSLVGRVVVGLYLLRIPLTARTLSSHGLLPYVSHVLGHLGELAHFSGNVSSSNVLYSFPLTGYVAFGASRLGSYELAQSLTPAPSFMTDWARLAPSLRLNKFVPYSALGELGNHGLVTLVVYFFVTGLVIALMSRVARSLTAPHTASLWPLVISGAAAYFCLQSLEYNLRSTTRVVYYAAALFLVVRLLSRRTSAKDTA